MNASMAKPGEIDGDASVTVENRQVFLRLKEPCGDRVLRLRPHEAEILGMLLLRAAEEAKKG